MRRSCAELAPSRPHPFSTWSEPTIGLETLLSLSEQALLGAYSPDRADVATRPKGGVESHDQEGLDWTVLYRACKLYNDLHMTQHIFVLVSQVFLDRSEVNKRSLSGYNAGFQG